MKCIPARYTAAGRIEAEIGSKAWLALLEEVYTTPKPGLVDLYSNGAHTDMDVYTFERSADAIKPYFIQMAYQGYSLCCSYEELFRQIRKTGLLAERAMYRATNGVNTHKGLIFTIGIYCAAAGRCVAERGRITAENIRGIQQEMTVRILEKELGELKSVKRDAATNGERNLRKYGTYGVRGEAIDGYRSVWGYALPVFCEGLLEHRNYNDVKLQTLFVLMSRVQDSNILARHNSEALRDVQARAANFLHQGGAYRAGAAQKLLELDREYTLRNISPGGCADLLATTIFLAKLLHTGV